MSFYALKFFLISDQAGEPMLLNLGDLSQRDVEETYTTKLVLSKLESVMVVSIALCQRPNLSSDKLKSQQ